MTTEEIVMNMLYDSPDFGKPMTLEIAKNDVANIQRDALNSGDELPDDFTPERYMEIWNSFCDSNV